MLKQTQKSIANQISLKKEENSFFKEGWVRESRTLRGFEEGKRLGRMFGRERVKVESIWVRSFGALLGYEGIFIAMVLLLVRTVVVVVLLFSARRHHLPQPDLRRYRLLDTI
ncbi:hypothetical protein PIB30_031523 [Stylosanthes scabra]|uniref:Uncharacterized protein n=1 Tax=Stylosanthes scabra TaxID=79078 RepID=A0ABU6YAM1_9FABA|nr:hypothetical protein [Stylosanthes scabra]